MVMDAYSQYGNDWYTQPILQVYHLTVDPSRTKEFHAYLQEVKLVLSKQLGSRSFVWMKTISGGEVGGYQLFIGFTKMEELHLLHQLFDHDSGTSQLHKNYSLSVSSNSSELWRFSAKLTSIP